MQYRVTMYEVRRNADGLSLQMTQVASAIRYAPSAQIAAARLWIESLGRARRARLEELGAPESLVRHETNVMAIAYQLRPLSLEGTDGLLLTTSFESWVFDVETQPANAAKRFEGSLGLSDKLSRRSRFDSSNN